MVTAELNAAEIFSPRTLASVESGEEESASIQSTFL
jgi:hypothetical protein